MSGPKKDHTKNPSLPFPESITQTFLEFWQPEGCDHSLRSLFSPQTPSKGGTFPDIQPKPLLSQREPVLAVKIMDLATFPDLCHLEPQEWHFLFMDIASRLWKEGIHFTNRVKDHHGGEGGRRCNY